jgi:DNA-binding NarL/FixJ family response regulator
VDAVSETIRVLIVDDDALVRSGLRLMLAGAAGIDVVGEVADGRGVLAAIDRYHTDVVLMDIRMPLLDGLAATRRLTEDDALKDVKVVMLTTFELDEYVFEAIRAGASGFLLKDTEPADLLRGLRAVASGEALLAPSVTRRLIEEFAVRSKRTGPNPAADQIKALTDREREVMTLVAAGLSNEEIADRLVLSPLTAKTHVSRSMVKLGVRDRAQLVVLAYESGLARPGWLD